MEENRHRKIAVVGTGMVGSTISYHLMVDSVCDDVVLIDTNKERVWAHVHDLRHAQAYLGGKAAIYEGGFSDCADADIAIITASPPYRAGMKRMDLLQQSGAVIKDIVPRIMGSGFSGIIIVLTNPVDVITYYVWKLSGLPATRVIGTGTFIDTIRAIDRISLKLGVSPHAINAFCIGEHAGVKFIPSSSVTISGVHADNYSFGAYMDATAFLSGVMSDIEAEADRIVLGKGSTQYGVTASLMGLIKALLDDEKLLTPVSVLPEGIDGISGAYISVPAEIGADGVEKVLAPDLSDDERTLFCQAVNSIKNAANQLI